MMQRPPFSWSKSRKEMFDKCQRQYWFQYYGYWGGWGIKADLKTRSAYFLRNITPLDGIVGVVVHSSIKDFLIHYKNTGQVLDLGELFLRAEQEFNKIKRDTLSRKYRNTKKTLAIQEFNYNELSDKMLDAADKKIHGCLDNFDNYFQAQSIEPGEIKLIDDVESGFVEATVNGLVLKIYAVIDFGYEKSGILNIVDWKTGESSEESETWLQSVTYGLWAHEIMSYPFERMNHKIANLSLAQEFDYHYVEDDYKKAFEIINKSILEMLFLDNTWENESRFYITEKKEICAVCKFREICPKMKG